MTNLQENLLGKSKIEQVKIEQISPEDDKRRTLWEFHNDAKLKFGNGRFIEVKEPEAEEKTVLAGHYHDDVEVFYLAKGEIESFVLEDIETNERKTVKSIGQGTKIIIPAGIAHQLVFTKPAILLSFNETPTRDNTTPYEL